MSRPSGCLCHGSRPGVVRTASFVGGRRMLSIRGVTTGDGGVQIPRGSIRRCPKGRSPPCPAAPAGPPCSKRSPACCRWGRGRSNSPASCSLRPRVRTDPRLHWARVGSTRDTGLECRHGHHSSPRCRRGRHVAAPEHTAPGLSPSSEPEFPGCKPVCLPREALDLYDGRLEFWDGASETAWVCEPTRPYHEAPSRTLMGLATLVAGVRGSPIKGYGSMDLLLRDARGVAWRIRQADESVYLHPARARLPGARAMVLGEDDVPDVVLEVDHSTNVCRGKLRIYEAWGFPEVWVDVPHKRTASQEGAAAGADEPPARRRCLPGFGRSRAFAGRQAEEIHAALNETVPSAWTCAVLERVGMALSGLGRGRDRTTIRCSAPCAIGAGGQAVRWAAWRVWRKGSSATKGKAGPKPWRRSRAGCCCRGAATCRRA